MYKRQARSQAHITRETNYHLRKRLNVYTIDSNLRHQRLKFMQQVYANPVTNAQLLACLYGNLPWDPSTPTCANNRHMNQLYDDIVTAWTQIQTQAGHADTTKPTTWENNVVGPCMQHWLITRTPTELAKVLRHDNPFDKRNHKQTNTELGSTEDNIACETCSRMFKTVHALSVHKVKAHGERNQSTSDECNMPGL